MSGWKQTILHAHFHSMYRKHAVNTIKWIFVCVKWGVNIFYLFAFSKLLQ